MSSRNANTLVVLALFGLFSLVIVGLAACKLYRDEQFAHNSLPSQATVKHVWITRSSKGGIHYHVTYLFRDRYLRQWTTTTTIGQETYTRLRINEVVPVKYLDDETGRSRIDWPSEDQYHWHQDEVLMGIGLFVGAVGGLIFVGNRPRRTWGVY